MDRDNLKPVVKRFPKWMLLLLIGTVGLPIHVFMGVWCGVFQGFDQWYQKLKVIKELK